MDLLSSLDISAAGMRAQGTRLRVVAENIANKDSTSQEAGGDPYRRKTISFSSELDRATGLNLVKVDNIGKDPGDFELRFDPGHAAADENGYVKLPNVKTLIEMADMREAQRSYEANLRVLQSSRQMLQQTIQLLRG